ncbi:hypothetical protein H5410_035808 [Solanum commersonii]|uniref:Uncharacterized protein n=1 Tax=Solanum commersonii TaxID=4109 RepID=A0A9J5Y4R4_SOLCO|nr:hypothetical protein H5410_035808 [Solanum commersonii]
MLRGLFIFAAEPVSTRHWCGVRVGFGQSDLDTLTKAEKNMGKKRSISWPVKVDDDEVVTRSGCSMEKNNEEAKLTRIEREQANLFSCTRTERRRRAPWERTNNSKFFS